MLTSHCNKLLRVAIWGEVLADLSVRDYYLVERFVVSPAEYGCDEQQ